MERLALEEAICRVRGVAKKQRWNSKYIKVSLMNEELNKRHKADCIKDAEEHEQLAEWLEELKSYKEAEEQGLLVRLPVKIGDMIWDNDFGHPVSYEIKAFSYGYCDSYVEPDIEDQIIFYHENYSGSIAGAFAMSELGKTVFLTREEAERKLEEMKNGL